MTRLIVLLVLMTCAAARANDGPVYIGLDAELGHATSTSALAIRQGMLIAIDEINAAGGVLGGRRLELMQKDNRSVPARGVQNIKELARVNDLVAVMTGKYSPVVMESVPVAHELKLPLLDPWAAADDIVDNGFRPNFAFRLSTRDSWAMETLLEHARKRGLKRIGLLLANGAWGRSCLRAAERHAGKSSAIAIADVSWFNWGDSSLIGAYRKLIAAGAQAVVFVGNEMEGSALVREVATLPEKARVPILSHWGITGGDFPALAGHALERVEVSVVQTFSFIDRPTHASRRVVAAARRLFGIKDPKQILSPIGLAHAYDLTHLLARAVNRAGSTDRERVRDALEQLENVPGLVRFYTRPFTPERHEALPREQSYMARFRADGSLVRIH